MPKQKIPFAMKSSGSVMNSKGISSDSLATKGLETQIQKPF